MTYEYYLFSQLFHCIIIDSQVWKDTPYDSLYPCIMQYYQCMEYEWKDFYYENIENFLEENKKIITLALVVQYDCTKE